MGNPTIFPKGQDHLALCTTHHHLSLGSKAYVMSSNLDLGNTAKLLLSCFALTSATASCLCLRFTALFFFFIYDLSDLLFNKLSIYLLMLAFCNRDEQIVRLFHLIEVFFLYLKSPHDPGVFTSIGPLIPYFFSLLHVSVNLPM